MPQSHPPPYVKLISVVTTAIFGSIATRNIFSPGAATFLPKDDNLQLFFFGVPPSEITRGQACHSNLLGHMILVVLGAKLTTVFSATSEGTFLRRNLLVAFGLTELVMGISMFSRFEGDLNRAGASFKGLSTAMCLEGSIFLYDALFRKRVVKDKKN